MKILELNDYAKNKIDDYLNSHKINDNVRVSISNQDLESTILLYNKVLQQSGDCICQFASNSGGCTSYHYCKYNGNFYVITAYIQEITDISYMDNEWIEIYESLYKNLQN
tara:strand:- start:191 stop:520 length:330 start_codon:yes stop_codon:yes gene_type:complete